MKELTIADIMRYSTDHGPDVREFKMKEHQLLHALHVTTGRYGRESRLANERYISKLREEEKAVEGGET